MIKVLNKRHTRKFKYFHLNKIDIFKYLWKKKNNNWKLINSIYDTLHYKFDVTKLSLRTDIILRSTKRKWQSLYEKIFLDRKLFYTFYYNLTYYDLRRIAIKAKRTNYAVIFYLLLLETRIDVILYRVNFLPSVYMIRQFIKYKLIKVNDNIVTSCNYRLKYYDILSFKNKKTKINVLRLLKSRLKSVKKENKNTFEINYPNYYEVFYPLLYATILPWPFPSMENMYFGTRLVDSWVIRKKKKKYEKKKLIKKIINKISVEKIFFKNFLRNILIKKYLKKKLNNWVKKKNYLVQSRLKKKNLFIQPEAYKFINHIIKPILILNAYKTYKR